MANAFKALVKGDRSNDSYMGVVVSGCCNHRRGFRFWRDRGDFCMDRAGPVCYLPGHFPGCFADGEKAPGDISRIRELLNL